MKKLFIYYSLTGNGDIVAPLLEKKGYEIRKVIAKKKLPKSFFWRVMIGGFLAGLGIKDKLVDYNPDAAEYDEIVIGSPIWNGRFPPAINGVLRQTIFGEKKPSFILYAGSGEGPKAEQVILKRFGETNVIKLKEPKKYEEELRKVEEAF